MKKFLLEVIVFVCGALVMVFELVGARVLGPYVGTSLFVWTSLIGIILGSLSLGYFLGGKLSDHKPEYAIFGMIILFAGVAILVTAISKDFILRNLSHQFFDIRWLAVLSSMILFAPGSLFLGMVSPFAVKLKIHSLQKSGSTVGNLYAISTVGSIAGTFAGGFYLIPFFGSSSLVYLIAVLLIFTALAIFVVFKRWAEGLLAISVLLVAGYFYMRAHTKTRSFVDEDTLYNRVMIYDAEDSKSGKQVKFMRINDERSSAMFLEEDGLVFPYLKYYDLAAHFYPGFKNVLMLGGSGYAYPKYFLEKYPERRIDVVEIDQQLTNLARQHFKLKDDPNLTIFHEDARTFFNHNNRKYDAILTDVFNSQFTLPFQLTTREFVQHQYDALTDSGLVIVNIISSIQNRGNLFLLSEAKTFRQVFKRVLFFAVNDPKNGDVIQNIMLVALKGDLPANGLVSQDSVMNVFLSKKITLDIPENIPVLTDDYAPVEYFVSKMISQYYGAN